jgi:predicted anti-sigma-YlaC factor YlaD
MNCSEIQRNLIKYLDGDLQEDMKIRMEEHLDQCTACLNYYTVLKNTWNNLGKDRIPHQPFFYEKLRYEMERREAKPSFTTYNIRKWILQPAMYFVILGFGIYLGIQLGRGFEPQNFALESDPSEYIDTYVNSQYLNGMELEVIEKEFLIENQDINTIINE